MVSKKALSESNICDRYVTPALDTAGWTTNQWRREFGFTDGKLLARGKRKRADYLLFKANHTASVSFALLASQGSNCSVQAQIAPSG